MIKEICRNLDYTLLLTVVMLIIIGIIMIHSASTGENIESSGVWKKQIFWAFFSLVIMLAMVPIPQKFLYAFSYVFYGVGLLLLILTELYGAIGGGSERWLVFGPVRFQPSEFMKIATIFTLARFLSYKKNRPTSYTKCIVPFLIICVPMILVRMQPDLGTSLVFGALVLPMLYWAGLDIVRIFFLIAPVLSAIFTAPFIPISNPVLWAVFMFILLSLLFYSRYRLPVMGIIIGTNILAGIATPYVFTHLEPYQQRRITTIFNPEADPLDSGYQLINSKIAIGSGGLLGKGVGKGPYTELGFLPRSHTDFIFSVIGEELGFVGSVFILGLLFFIVYRGVMIATEVKNPFFSIAAIGIATVFMFHMFINISMVLGLMPVTGLPLPFLSYGGSSCLSNAVMVGLLLNFKVHRHEF